MLLGGPITAAYGDQGRPLQPLPSRPTSTTMQRPPRRARQFDGHDRQPFVEVSVDPSEYMHRRNSSDEALGKFRRFVLYGHRFYYPVDSCTWWVPTVMTAFIVAGNMAVAWSMIGWPSFVIVVTLVSTGFLSSYLATCTDPGVYPKLKPGEADPLAAYEGLVYCRVCQLRRPPRTAHCYQCNVCVLESDHHCSVLGSCVGLRSLRWFTLFLVCQSTACCIGVYWQVSLVYDGISRTEAHGRAHPTTATISTTLPPGMSQLGKKNYLRRRNRAGGEMADLIGVTLVLSIFVILINLVVIVLVGCLGIMYTSLVLTSTTRRESNKRGHSCCACVSPRRMWQNFLYTAFPPPSLLDEDGRYRASSGVQLHVVVEGEVDADGGGHVNERHQLV